MSDNGEEYPYLYPEADWKIVVYGLTISGDRSPIRRLHNAATGEILYELPDTDVSVSDAFAYVLGDDSASLYLCSGAKCDIVCQISEAELLDE